MSELLAKGLKHCRRCRLGGGHCWRRGLHLPVVRKSCPKPSVDWPPAAGHGHCVHRSRLLQRCDLLGLCGVRHLEATSPEQHAGLAFAVASAWSRRRLDEHSESRAFLPQRSHFDRLIFDAIRPPWRYRTGAFPRGSGSWLIFTTKEQDQCNDLHRKAWELGINFYDTANQYHNGDAELAVGEALSPFRARPTCWPPNCSGRCRTTRSRRPTTVGCPESKSSTSATRV